MAIQVATAALIGVGARTRSLAAVPLVTSDLTNHFWTPQIITGTRGLISLLLFIEDLIDIDWGKKVVFILPLTDCRRFLCFFSSNMFVNTVSLVLILFQAIHLSVLREQVADPT